MKPVTFPDMRLRGSASENPIAARRFRSVQVTEHAMGRRAEWDWPAQSSEDDAFAVLLIPTVALRLARGGGVWLDAPAGSLCFLHPHRQVTVRAAAEGTLLCAWVPWDALADIESGVRAPSEVIPPSDLGRGLHAFLTSLITQRSDPTVYTNYLVERLIAEMVFSVLVEAAPRLAIDGLKGTEIERARSIMLIQRSDPAFHVATLARDMHVSVRQLQRIFAAAGSTPAGELRRMRVELARELMRDAGYSPLGISEIAEHAGFADAAGMRRAFALSGLPSPRAVRVAASV